jgi:hypothetical protein
MNGILLKFLKTELSTYNIDIDATGNSVSFYNHDADFGINKSNFNVNDIITELNEWIYPDLNIFKPSTEHEVDFYKLIERTVKAFDRQSKIKKLVLL